VVEDAGDDAEVSETKGFECITALSAADDDKGCEIEEWEGTRAEGEEGEKWAGVPLTKENVYVVERETKAPSKNVPMAIERFLDGMCVGWEPGEEGKSSMCGKEVVELMCLLADVGLRKR
jgi:hypothetical protein